MMVGGKERFKGSRMAKTRRNLSFVATKKKHFHDGSMEMKRLVFGSHHLSLDKNGRSLVGKDQSLH